MKSNQYIACYNYFMDGLYNNDYITMSVAIFVAYCDMFLQTDEVPSIINFSSFVERTTEQVNKVVEEQGTHLDRKMQHEALQAILGLSLDYVNQGYCVDFIALVLRSFEGIILYDDLEVAKTYQQFRDKTILKRREFSPEAVDRFLKSHKQVIYGRHI